MKAMFAQIAADWARDPYQAFLCGCAFGLAVGVASTVFVALHALRRLTCSPEGH